MTEDSPSKSMRNKLLKIQEFELTGYYIYDKLASRVKNSHNQGVLKSIAQSELNHYNFWKKYTNQEISRNRLKVAKYILISKLFGLTFGIKLLEKEEAKIQELYGEILVKFPEAAEIVKEEEEHEKLLIGLLKERHLEYIGSTILGLNDALIELTGALAGLTLVLQNTKTIAIAGLITGFAASLSMAASEYLSKKTDNVGKNPVKASIYTGTAYVITVFFLVIPYFIFSNEFICLSFTILISILIIFVFTYYASVSNSERFKPKFLEMVILSMGVASITFAIGFLVRTYFNLEPIE